MTTTTALQAQLEEMERRKDGAYEERNRVVAALAKCFPSGVARPAIEGWSEDWHGCVYIDLPTGQVSWHFHDSQAHLFAGLPAYTKPWDGHDTPEKYRRVAALSAPAQECQASSQWESMNALRLALEPDARPLWYGTERHSAPAQDAQAEPAVTEEMITAYLDANNRYWKETDDLDRPISKWRNGTPSEATRVSLQAALRAARTQPATPVDAAATVPDLRERLAEAHDASLDTDHHACQAILMEIIRLLDATPPAAPQAQAEHVQAVIEAARNWCDERGPQDWSEAELMKAIATLDGDWPGCEGCDFHCGESCTPATVAEQHAAIDAALGDFKADKKEKNERFWKSFAAQLSTATAPQAVPLTNAWCYSTDEEVFHGPVDSREEAVAEVEAEGGWVARVRSPREFLGAKGIGQSISDDIGGLLFDEVGEVAENFSLKPDKCEALGRVVIDWIEAGPGFHCWGVKDIERIEPVVIGTTATKGQQS